MTMTMMMNKIDLLDEARAIAEEYQEAGYSLTLRQLYYQLVSRAMIPNSQKSYNRLGSVIGEARLRGRFDLDLIVDRGRTAGASAMIDCKVEVRQALREAGEYVGAIPSWALTVDRWFGQPVHVSAWVEKEALAGVFDGPCEDLGVGFFACKGYPSHSSLWQWIQHYRDACEAADVDCWGLTDGLIDQCEIREAVVLYFGDHDPDGWQIPRSAESTINTLIDVAGLELPPVRFERVALNMDQIQEHNPPPYPAKPSSSRYKKYVIEHDTQDAWELDALEPSKLDELIRTSVSHHWSHATHADWQDIANRRRRDLRAEMAKDGWAADQLA